MGGRWFHIAVLIAWLVSMSWLFVEKLLPTFRGGRRPAYDAYLAETEEAPQPVGWRLEWDDADIGWALMQSERGADGTVEVRSLVQFESLPVDRIVTELLGTMGPLIRRSVLGPGDLRLDLTVNTSMGFAADGALHSFETGIHSGSVRNLLRVAGTVADGTLQVVVYGYLETDDHDTPQLTELYRQDVALPADALVSDTFSPQPRLVDLHVGQRWTFPMYRPFPPGRPTEIIEARVERETGLLYAGSSTPVYLVVYRREAGSGISAAQEPTGRMWVRRDGTVLKQEVRVANLHLTFHRSPVGHFRERAAALDPTWDALDRGT